MSVCRGKKKLHFCSTPGFREAKLAGNPPLLSVASLAGAAKTIGGWAPNLVQNWLLRLDPPDGACLFDHIGPSLYLLYCQVLGLAVDTGPEYLNVYRKPNDGWTPSRQARRQRDPPVPPYK